MHRKVVGGRCLLCGVNSAGRSDKLGSWSSASCRQEGEKEKEKPPKKRHTYSLESLVRLSPSQLLHRINPCIYYYLPIARGPDPLARPLLPFFGPSLKAQESRFLSFNPTARGVLKKEKKKKKR